MDSEQDDSRYEIHHLCRGCVRVGDETTLFPLFTKDSSLETSYIDLIQAFNFINLKIKKNDGLPQQICKTCIADLTHINNFRKACEKSQIVLKEYFLKHLNKQGENEEIEYDDLEFLNEYEDQIEDITNCEYEEDHSNDITLEEIDDTNHNEIANDFEFTELSENTNSIIKNPEKPKVILDIRINENNEESDDIIETNEDTISYSCGDCKENFSNELLLKEHSCSLNDNKVQNWNCRYCEEEFANEEKLEEHMTNVHFFCSICEQTFITAGILAQHSEIHTPKDIFECDICNQGFRNPYYVTRHKKALHEKGFNLHDSLKLHLQKHSGVKPYVCKICEKGFYIQYYYKMHMKTHEGIAKLYHCDICGKNVQTKLSLENHIRTHTGERPFKCDICDKNYAYKQLLIAHKCVVNKNDNEIETEGERKYRCNECGSSFKKSKILQAHISRIHLKRRPHKCNICDKAFFLPFERNIHEKSHTDERLHECKICGKPFKNEKAVIAHLRRVHSREKPYECGICLMGFPTYISLETHKTVHSEGKRKEEHENLSKIT